MPLIDQAITVCEDTLETIKKQQEFNKVSESVDYWNKVMSLKDKDDRKRGVANTLDKYDLETIYATAGYWGAESTDIQQMIFDLEVARYRVFDWLAMGVMSANSNPRIPVEALKVFVYSFLKSNGVVSAFIEDLQNTDYEIDTEWREISFEGDK